MRIKVFCLLLAALIMCMKNSVASAADERGAIFNKLQALLDSSPAASSGKVSMLFIPAGSEVQSTGDMVIRALGRASSSKIPVAIVGPDSRLNLEIVTLATVNCPQGILHGVTVFYLGQEGDNDRLSNLRGKCGAEVIFGTYP